MGYTCYSRFNKLAVGRWCQSYRYISFFHQSTPVLLGKKAIINVACTDENSMISAGNTSNENLTLTFLALKALLSQCNLL